MNFDNSYARLPFAFFKAVSPEKAPSPRLALFNEKLALDLGVVDYDPLDFTPNGSMPIAQAYAGHQFGHFNMLGDGRAILLGEHVTRSGERFDIQLKGSGVTPYSRRGDGKATLKAMVREYIISEAMAGLGIATTRSLAVVLTGEAVHRETGEQGAVLTRVASSHIRVGTFQYAAALQDIEALRVFTDYVIARHDAGASYVEFLQRVIARQAALIARWITVGFIHGVMNTDNMSICGETIDYGPCAFMDHYDPNTVFSSIDTTARYAYGNQPKIGLWNLTRFAETLIPLLHDDEDKAIAIAEEALGEYGSLFQTAWLGEMRLKMGLMNEEEEDGALVQGFLDHLQVEKLDYTNSFRELAGNMRDDGWFALYHARLARNSVSLTEAREMMNAHNPYIIARNHKVEEALSAVNYGDYTFVNKLVEALQKPFTENAGYADLREPSKNVNYKTFCGT